MAQSQFVNMLRQPKVIAAAVLFIAAVTLVVINLRGGPRPDYGRNDRTADTLMQLAPALETAIKANPQLASLDELQDVAADEKRDAWGNPIQMRTEGEGREREIRLVSGGEDGAMGTADDLTAIFNQVWISEYDEPGLNFVRIERPAATPAGAGG